MTLRSNLYKLFEFYVDVGVVLLTKIHSLFHPNPQSALQAASFGRMPLTVARREVEEIKKRITQLQQQLEDRG